MDFFHFYLNKCCLFHNFYIDNYLNNLKNIKKFDAFIQNYFENISKYCYYNFLLKIS